MGPSIINAALRIDVDRAHLRRELDGATRDASRTAGRQAGDTLGTEMATAGSARLRDEKGKFIKAGTDIGGDTGEAMGKAMSREAARTGVFSEKNAAEWKKRGQQMTLGFTLPVVAGFSMAVNAAAEAADSVDSLNYIFSEMGATATTWATDTADAIALSDQQASQNLATIGQLLTSAGMSQDEAFAQSTALIERAVDISSLQGKSLDEVLTAVVGGLTGEAEGLKRFGVDVSAAAVEAEALRLGLVETTVDALKVRDATDKVAASRLKLAEVEQKHGHGSREAKAAATDLALALRAQEEAAAGTAGEISRVSEMLAFASLYFQQTDVAAGNFAETMDSPANQLRVTAAAFADFGVAVGTELLPVLSELLPHLVSALEWFSDLPDPVKTATVAALGLGAALGPLVSIGANLVTVLPKLTSIFTSMGGAAGGAAGGVGALGLGLAGVGVAAMGVSGAGKDGANAGDYLMGIGGGAATGAAIGSVIPGLGTGVGAVIGGIVGGVATYASGQGAPSGSTPTPSPTGSTPGVTFQAARGGVARSRPGGVMINAAEAGHDEVFAPLSGSASPFPEINRKLDQLAGTGGNGTVNVYLDGELIASQSMRRMDRRANATRVRTGRTHR